MTARLTLVGLLIGFCSLAQAENKSNPSPPGATPPASQPVQLLSAEEEAKALKLPVGFRAEVVAAEPMVEHPVALTFDPDGRVWVVEMRAYMPDFDGKGENEPKGRISVLEDTDGDGRMDKSIVFLDKLVMPRAICLIRGGVLVATPPELNFWKDTNGDGVADKKELVASDYGIRGNVEHQPNGLLLAIDNWIYNADYGKRFKNEWDKWIIDSTPEMGQWGITQDDVGRLFFNTNSDHLRGSAFGPHYVLRNPYSRTSAANLEICSDQNVWPAHATAVNRGYQKNFLRDGGKLAKFTGACAPLVYRGGAFPAEFHGNAFVCEPTANLIRRSVITEDERGRLTARNAYDKDEFVTSTYERFRPVNLNDGPDGAIWVVDMHHGLIQHTDYMTDYLKKDYTQRELQKHLATGRIFRIVRDGAPRPVKPNLSKTAPKELVPLLAHISGWWRDTAQRLLVEKNTLATVPLLVAMVKSHENPLARIHALWTLEGMRRIDIETVVVAMSDRDPRVRAAGIRVSEFFLKMHRRGEMLPHVLKLAADRDPTVQLQFALTISELGAGETDDVLAKILSRGTDSSLVREAAITGARGRELELLAMCVGDAKTPHATLAALAACVMTEASPKRIPRLLDLIATQDLDRQIAMLEAITPSRGGRRVNRRDIMLTAEPPALAVLYKIDDEQLQQKLEALLGTLHWPGQPGYVPPAPPPPLTAPQQAQFEAGRIVYSATCAQCHKPHGMGQDGLAPPLLDSEWTIGPPEIPIRIVLHGLRGPMTVAGQTYNMEMPSVRLLNDQQIADVLTYIRREWEHGGSPVSPELVAKVRTETDGRQDAWTQTDLAQLQSSSRAPTSRRRDD